MRACTHTHTNNLVQCEKKFMLRKGGGDWTGGGKKDRKTRHRCCLVFGTRCPQELASMNSKSALRLPLGRGGPVTVSANQRINKSLSPPPPPRTIAKGPPPHENGRTVPKIHTANGFCMFPKEGGVRPARRLGGPFSTMATVVWCVGVSACKETQLLEEEGGSAPFQGEKP